MALEEDEIIRQALLNKIRRSGPGFINPYNFVRLGAACRTAEMCSEPPSHEKFAGLSGEIVCELEVITPLCVAERPKTDEEDETSRTKPFFRLDGEPCIPATSLKGMIRSVAEALTDSCMPVLTQHLAIFRDNRRWVPETRGVGRMSVGAGAKLQLNNPGNNKITFGNRGLFNKGEPGYTDRDNPRASGESVPAEIKTLYERMVEDPGFTRHVGDKESHPDPSEEKWLKNYKDGKPWWFRTVRGHVVEIGRNFRYKWAYDPREAIPELYYPCKEPNSLCPVCRLFGMAAEDGGDEREVNAYAGRVRFTRGSWQGSDVRRLQWVRDLKILGAPHISNRSFYLFPRTRRFNLGRMQNEDGSIEPAEEFLQGLAPTPARGRKFYWHHTKIWDGNDLDYLRLKPVNGRRKRTNQNADVEVMLPGEKFRFSVSFENLAEWELGLLLWVLALPEGIKPAHHLGLGKPLGMGTCVVRVLQLSLIDRKSRYEKLYTDGKKVLGSDGKDARPLKLVEETLTLKALLAFSQQLSSWFGGLHLHEIPHVRELLVMLSREQPAPADIDRVPITYPPGINAMPKAGDLHPTEKHFTWFTGQTKVRDEHTGAEVTRYGWDWSQRLLTIMEIVRGGRQLRVPGEVEKNE